MASAFMNMTFLRSCMVSVTTTRARSRRAPLAGDEVGGHDAEGLAAGGHGGAGDRAHQADVAGAVDEAEARRRRAPCRARPRRRR